MGIQQPMNYVEHKKARLQKQQLQLIPNRSVKQLEDEGTLMHAPTGASQPTTQPLKLQRSIQKDQQHQIILIKESHAERIDHLKPSTTETNNNQTNNLMEMKNIYTHYHMTFQNMIADHINVSIYQRLRKSTTNHKKQQTIAKTLPSN